MSKLFCANTQPVGLLTRLPRRRLALVLVIALFSCVAASAATRTTVLHLSEYQKQDWQVEDGLPENYVRTIAQRPDGDLLLATSSGLATFDGLRFKNVPLEVNGLIDNEAVNSVLYGKNHDLWIGTDGRGVLYRSGSGTVNISERMGRFNERVRAMHEDAQGVLWIATQNGVERFSGEKMEVLSSAGMISGDITTPFAEDGFGGMFFVTASGLFHWSDGVVHPFPLRSAGTPVAVYRDEQQRLWVGTAKGVLQLVLRKGNAREFSDRFDQVPRATVSAPVTVLLGDAMGNLWIGTRGGGLWRLGEDGVSHWSSSNGLADDTIRSLLVDKEQNLWIGMRTGGLSRWRKGAFAPYGTPEGFRADLAANTFADSHGDLWLGTWGKGLFRRHNGQLQPMSPPGMPVSTPIRALAEDRRGQIWVGTWFDGIYRYDGRAFHHYLLGIESPGNAVSSILASRDGGLWVGTYTGLFYFPGGEPTATHPPPLLESKLITCITEDVDGSILVGTSTGLYRVRNGVAIAVSGLPHSYILCVTLDSLGSAWVGTKAGGLSLIRGEETTSLPKSSGIAPLLVSTAIEDNDNHFWLATSRGIVRISIAELHEVAAGKQAKLSTVVLGKGDGMRSSECDGVSKPAATRTADGTLWFATAKGFVHTTDVAEKVGAFSPDATVTGWTLSNDPSTADTLTGSNVELEAGQTDVIFFFNSSVLSNPAHVEYRYRLAGYDSDWTNTYAHSARYRHLSPGSFRFEVQARNSGEAWVSPIASLPVRQMPHLYQTWYFYVALVLVTAGLAVHLFRRRVQMMKGRIGIVLEERNRISRECHDTLMAGFAAISWQLEATSKLFHDSDSAATPAAKSCELARSMVSHCQAEARRIIWDLRDTEEVTNILSLALSRTLATNHMQDVVRTTLDVEGEEIALTPSSVHHLVCIGQEAVSNAIRHAQPSAIAIHLKYEADAVYLSIRDDGRGFHLSDRSESRRGHFGIPVMEERARKLGGTLRMQSSLGAGTEVVVRVSFKAMQQPLRQEQHIIRWIGI
ncbi:sensor histidine kinase [Granulicella paludicola]|uniref:sensor histidine kinase n=1 Tax=Granulicella paludicola TaxID=474951 RepID=UPI0021E03C95|nr:sensor histidine kinase [Granulicella paludicola]